MFRLRSERATVQTLLFRHAAEIARLLSAVDKKIETEEKRKAALQALFKTMLHLLMTDQIRVKIEDYHATG